MMTRNLRRLIAALMALLLLAGCAACAEEEQKDLLAFHSKLFTWRQSEPAIHRGKTMHFYAADNTYSFFRYLDDEAVFVFVNAGPQQVSLPIDHYKEMLDIYGVQGFDVMTGKQLTLTARTTIPALGYLIVKLHK